MAPGILYVTMQPGKDLPSTQFHDWYNNEHGPLRLRLPFVKNGFRYRATDLDGPAKGKHEWMAIYDMTDLNGLNGDEYMKLRGPPHQSQRERDVRPHVDIDRRSYEFVSERSIPNFKKLEDIGGEKEGNVVVHVGITPNNEITPEELTRWYDEEHIDMLSKVPGWRRTRRFKTSPLDKKDETEYIALHEYAPQNGLGGPEFQAATSTDWAKKIKAAVELRRRVYEHYYTFGPAPRDLSSPIDWDAPPLQTKTTSAGQSGRPVVESYITTHDGAQLPYRLEGSSDPDAPVIVCSNSILVTYGIWDNFVNAFFSKSENKKYRVLRYLTRGRSSNAGSGMVSVDKLGDDIVELLDALRVPKAALIIGVSLGGATVLNVGLRHPDRVERFIACDTNAKSPAGNSKAWKERIEMAEKEGASAQVASGETQPIVGEELAEITTRRWFVKESYDGGAMEKECHRVKDMVRTNSLEGFRQSVQALWEYDMEPQMKGCKVKGAFLVGSGDGVLPGTMRKMAEDLAGGVQCTVIEGAGHLPMVEKPEQVAEVVTKMLSH